MAAKKTRSPLACATHAAYQAANRAGVLHFGRPVRPSQRHRDERKESGRRACRGKEREDG